jgi:hypothetical protein
MAEQEFEIRPVGVKYICDKCSEGEMLPEGEASLSDGRTLYPHSCSKCGHKEVFNERYKKLIWKLA